MTDDEILASYHNWLRVVAGNLIGFGNANLQDLVQEGYIAMWKAMSSFDSSHGELDYWLKYKARFRMKTLALRGFGTYRDQYEQPGRDDSDEDPLEQAAGPDLLEGVEMAYHQGELADAISSLTPAQRRYVTARFWLGLSGKEMRDLGVFRYDPSALWNSKKNGARWKLAGKLDHLAAA